MTTPAPWLQTKTVNPQDQPLVVYLQRHDHGFRWAFNVKDGIPPDVLHRAFADLALTAVKWSQGRGYTDAGADIA
jgi:hypothetical protein